MEEEEDTGRGYSRPTQGEERAVPETVKLLLAYVLLTQVEEIVLLKRSCPWVPAFSATCSTLRISDTLNTASQRSGDFDLSSTPKRITQNDCIQRNSLLVCTFSLLGWIIRFLLSNLFFYEIIVDQAALLPFGTSVFLWVLAAVAARRHSTHTPRHNDHDQYHIMLLFVASTLVGISVGCFLSQEVICCLLFGIPLLYSNFVVGM
jgi:hypothetical protein